ncbi:MAG: hypothetical protein GVY07_03150 [Bacteroidetes bacterium]|jgi:sugar lactone lactonase YvrE|nr:hypothetical protein [Bacteroidota bacterium]
MKSYLKTIFSVIFFIAFILTSCLNKGNDNHSITIEYRDELLEYQLPYRNFIELQESEERIWKTPSVSKIYDASDGLFSPIRLTLKDSTVYILDPADGYIKAIDRDKTTIRKIGPGKGNGPGEVSFPFDFDIDESGNFILIDINKRALITWDKDGVPIDAHFFKHASPTTLTSAGERKAVIMVSGSHTEFSDTGFFQFYDIEGSKVTQHQDFLTNTEHLPPFIGLERAFTGRILFDNHQTIYLPRHLNHIIYISSTGEIDLVRQTVDDIQLPTISSNSENSGSTGFIASTSLSGNSEIANLDGFLVDNNLVIWSRPGNNKYGFHVFDYYDRNNADYKFSVKIPELGAVAGLSMNENYIATINSDHSVSLWEYSITE